MEKRTEVDEAVLGWVEALQQGRDLEANSRRIFRRYYGWVRGFFAERLHNDSRAEDLAQETFTLAFRRIESFRHDGNFDSWLFAIAANLLRNEWRRLFQEKRAAPEVSLDSDKPEKHDWSQLAGGAKSPEGVAAAKQRLREVMTAIEALPARQRDCLRLRLADHDYRDIGELLNMEPSTARVHVHAARQRLNRLFPDGKDGLE